MSYRAGRWTRLLFLTTALAQLTIVALAPALDAHVSRPRPASVAPAVAAESGGSVHDSGFCAACAVMNAAWELGSPRSHLLPARVIERPTAGSTDVVVRATFRSLQLPRAPPTHLA